MKIFELLNPQANQQLQDLDQQGQNPEDDSQGKFDAGKVDSQLQDIAQEGGDEQAQPDLPQGAPSEPPELDSQNSQPIDDALLAQTKNLPYAKKWKPKEKSPISPINIAKMDLAGLSNLRNMVRLKSQMASYQSPIADNQNTDMEYYNDLLKFIDTVSSFKKTSTKAQLAQTNPTPAYQQPIRSK